MSETSTNPQPKLEHLPADIEALFNPDEHHEINEENLELFAENLKASIRRRFKKQEERGGALRFSMMGRPDRQVWFEANPVAGSKEPLLPKVYMKFLYGDIIEELYLFLAREAGHEVSDEQREVEVRGVLGHIDAIIDGVVVDVKSASPYGYQKFEEQSVHEGDDPFGYVGQLAGYANVLTPGNDAAWLAVNKVSGDVCVSVLPKMVIKHHDPEERIAHLQEIISKDELPPLCYEPVPDGKSGNMKLPTGCSYCPHKFRCYPDLRIFIYASGPRYLTKVVKEPNVPEVEINND